DVDHAADAEGRIERAVGTKPRHDHARRESGRVEPFGNGYRLAVRLEEQVAPATPRAGDTGVIRRVELAGRVVAQQGRLGLWRRVHLRLDNDPAVRQTRRGRWLPHPIGALASA